jgi:predicted transcriptional regulator
MPGAPHKPSSKGIRVLPAATRGLASSDKGHRRKSKNHAAFVQVYKDEWHVFVCEHHLTRSQWQCYEYLLSCLEWGNWTHVSQSQMGEDLQYTPAQVSRALKSLEHVGLLVRESGPGQPARYRMHARYVYCGYQKDRNWQQKHQRRRLGQRSTSNR